MAVLPAEAARAPPPATTLPHHVVYATAVETGLRLLTAKVSEVRLVADKRLDLQIYLAQSAPEQQQQDEAISTRLLWHRQYMR